jgi:hypothetical protein
MAMPVSELEMEALPELAHEHEMEHEFESHELHETEISPVRKWYPDAMLEHLGFAAAEAETEEEAAEGFLPLIPMLAAKALPMVAKIGAKVLPKLARKVLPRAARSLSRVEPRLTRGVSQITRGLYRNPRTRPLVRTVPAIARRTMATLARRAAVGRPITPRMANRVLVSHTRRLLRSPRQTARILRRARLLDRRFHRVSGGVAQPHLKLPAVVAGARGAGRACVCPACGASPWRVSGASRPGFAPAPAYCRCCGQILR